MRIFSRFKNRPGSLTAAERGIRFRYMITELAQKRATILTFWKKYGSAAVREAYGVSGRTLYRWQRELRKTKGKLEALNKGNTVPIHCRTRMVPDTVSRDIITLRMEHPRLGKEKLAVLLCVRGYTLSASTVGRILFDLKQSGRLSQNVHMSLNARSGRLTERPYKSRKKLRRPKGYRVLEVDTIVRFVDGAKRYILTAVDTEKRTTFAACYTNHGSASTADFLAKCTAVLPDCPKAIQTDNGSEFALHFDRAVEHLGMERFHTYPRSPKMNAHVERFNRTLNEEFLSYNRGLMRDDVAAFNDKLVDWLLWYNGERPHYALGQRSPFQCMMSALPTTDCHMWWTHTALCF